MVVVCIKRAAVKEREVEERLGKTVDRLVVAISVFSLHIPSYSGPTHRRYRVDSAGL